MIVLNNKQFYALGIQQVIKDDRVYYNREQRQKSYFYIDLSLADSPDAIRIRTPTMPIEQSGT